MTSNANTRTVTPARKPATRRERTSHSLPSAQALLDAVPLPCAVFAEADGELQMHNAAFAAEFPNLDRHTTRSEFLRQFEDAPELQAGNEEVEAFHAESRRWYALRSVRFAAADHAAELLTVANVSARNETLRRHKTQAERLLFTSRVMSVGEMTTTLAHELNQPLAAIANYLKGSSRLIEHRTDEDAVMLREAMQKATDQAIRAGQIIRRLRDFVARGESERRVESVTKLVEEASALALVGAREQSVHVRFRLDPACDRVLADKVQVQQVLVNLIRNAIEAMADRPVRELTITSTPVAGGFTEISVADTGSGIAPEAAAQLFQPFFTTKRYGMGVGLSICRTIVEAHGGKIAAEPNPGGGTRFRFTLRMVDERDLDDE